MRKFKFIYQLIMGAALVSFCQLAGAEAGRVIFVYGDVTAQGNDGVVRYLSKRDTVEAGDTIRTSSRSLAQIRMIDKAFIALRANSEFKIEAYKIGAKKEEDTGIFSLIKGGFRAVTGIIGKRLRSAYKMRTVNATIGIRGTDYTARICNKDCNQAFGNLSQAGNIADGLYVGVNDGGVNLTNQLGTLDLDQLQFGYVKDATTAPVALLSAPEFLYFNSSPPSPDDNQASNSETDSTTDTVIATRAAVEPPGTDLIDDPNILKNDPSDGLPEKKEDPNETPKIGETEGGNPVILNNGRIEISRMIVTSYGKQGLTGSISTVSPNPLSAVQIDDRNLQSFENDSIDNGSVSYSSGTTTTIDLGFDPVTQIAWGRWNAGTVNLQNAASAASNLDFSNSSLHWITGPDQPKDFALPSTGTASYTLVGNTSPTDNLGNAGTLGSATLNADFVANSVNTSVAIGINNQVWNASGSNLPLSSTNGGFIGNLSTVDVNSGSSNFTGTGNAAGFITNGGDGAGMGFSLESNINGTDTTVTGTAIFQKN